MDGLAEQNEAGKASPHPVTINEPTDAPKLPPQLIDVLPPLPKQVEYAFVGRTLLLKDADAQVVLDILPDVLPVQPPPGVPTTGPAPIAGASVDARPAADPRRHRVRADRRQRIGRPGRSARSRRRCSPTSRTRDAFRSC